MNFKQGDLLMWSWKPEAIGPKTLDPYWAKSRVAVVLKDGRWVDTFWHTLSDSEHCWSDDFEVPQHKVDAKFLVNVADLVDLRGPREQYASDDTFHLCNGGGGRYQEFQRKDAKPVPELVLTLLKKRLDEAEFDERSAVRRQNRITEMIAELQAGKEVCL